MRWQQRRPGADGVMVVGVESRDVCGGRVPVVAALLRAHGIVYSGSPDACCSGDGVSLTRYASASCFMTEGRKQAILPAAAVSDGPGSEYGGTSCS